MDQVSHNPEPAAGLSEMPSEALANQITRLAAHLDAATCSWLLAVAELDRRGTWAEWGCRSTAHWLNWRAGVAMVSARQQVRVARRLGELALVRAAFGTGELSYSKVRAICRVATADNEAALVDLARSGTAAHLEAVVRAYRLASGEVSQANARHARRHLRWYHDDDGSLVISARLSPEDGAVVVNALRAAEESMAQRGAKAAGSAAPPDPAAPPEGDPGPPERHLRPPPGREQPEPEDPWAARQADALVAMAEAALASTWASRGGPERIQVVLHVGNDALTSDDPDARCELQDGPGLAPETARRLGCDASVRSVIEGPDGSVLDVGRRTRVVHTALRRALAERDKGCRYPSCTNDRFTDAHHVAHWAHGGATSLDNLVTLCRAHHRLVHEGGVSMRLRHGEPVFVRPDGEVIEAPVTSVAPGPDELVQRHRRQGLAIGPGTPVPSWAGERLDLGMAVDGLLWLDGRLFPAQDLPEAG